MESTNFTRINITVEGNVHTIPMMILMLRNGKRVNIACTFLDSNRRTRSSVLMSKTSDSTDSDATAIFSKILLLFKIRET